MQIFSQSRRTEKTPFLKKPRNHRGTVSSSDAILKLSHKIINQNLKDPKMTKATDSNYTQASKHAGKWPEKITNIQPFNCNFPFKKSRECVEAWMIRGGAIIRFQLCRPKFPSTQQLLLENASFERKILQEILRTLPCFMGLTQITKYTYFLNISELG